MHKLSTDIVFMQRAIDLAKSATRRASPNPGVGCVLVKNNQIIGEGATLEVGGDHAEIQAIKNCIFNGYSPTGSTAYVTLEPCCHYGKTPPCVLKLIEVGIADIKVAIEDPFPKVAGRGISTLKEAGILTSVGLLKEKALDVHRGFLSRVNRGRPWVTLKTASSLDGKVALLNKESKWITSVEARNDVQFLRANHCAILTGSGTVISDNPILNVRDISALQPKKFVIDGHLKTSLSSKLYLDKNTHIFTINKSKESIDLYRDNGIDVTIIDNVNGHVDLKQVLNILGGLGINNLLVESGPGLAGAMVKQNLVDEIIMYIAPLYLGEKAMGIFSWDEIFDLNQGVLLDILNSMAIGCDLKLVCRPKITN